MTEQLALFRDRDRSIAEQFESFDRAHPDVYERFARIARDLRAKGHARYSSDGILHVIRWHYATSGPDEATGAKINNNYSSRYARKLIEEDPSFAGFFATRAIKAE